MNRTYRLIWNDTLSAWIVVAEHVRARGKRTSKSIAGLALVALSLAASPASAAPPVNSLPSGGAVVAGSATIGQSGAVMNIDQSSSRAAIDWQSFNVGSAATVNFNQPGADSVTLNRVLDSNPSQIFGRLNAPGQVFLTNPGGIYFGAGASVNVGGLVATTHEIDNADFMAGHDRFVRTGSTAAVTNDGTLTAGLGGYIALLAPEVRNQGVIVAQLGTVALAAGEAFELQFEGSRSLAGVRVTPATIQALVASGNAIQAPGGRVILSASAANSLQGAVVKAGGVIEAKGLNVDGGRILLDSGENGLTTVDGALDASSDIAKGGRIVVAGERIAVGGAAQLSASGGSGGGEILVGGDWQGSDPDIRSATSVAIAPGARLDASATRSGNGGTVVAWSDVHNASAETHVHGDLRANGGELGGDGGRIETSGHLLDVAGVSGSAAAPAGRAGVWLFDPTNVLISNGGGAITGSTAALSSINATTLGTLLASTSVTITTPSAGSQDGDITVADAITKASGTATTLTLQAARNIYVNARIAGSAGSPLNVVLAARYTRGTSGGVGLNSSVLSYGGDITIGGGPLGIEAAIANKDVGSFMFDSGHPSGVLKQAGIMMRPAVDSPTLTKVFVDASADGYSLNGLNSSTTPTLIATAVSHLAGLSGGGNVLMTAVGDESNEYKEGGSQGIWISPGGVMTSGSGNVTVNGTGGYSNSVFWGLASAGIVVEAGNTPSWLLTGNGVLTINGIKGQRSDGGSAVEAFGYVSTASGTGASIVNIGSANGISLTGSSLMIRSGIFNAYAAGSGSSYMAFMGPIVGYNGSGAGKPTLNIQGNTQTQVTFGGDATGIANRNDGIFTNSSGTTLVYGAGLDANQTLALFSPASRPTSYVNTPVSSLTIRANGSATYGSLPGYSYVLTGGGLTDGDFLTDILYGAPLCNGCSNAATYTTSTTNNVAIGSLAIKPQYANRYSLAFDSSSQLVIDKATAVASGSRVYDGTLDFLASAFGSVKGIGSEWLAISGAGVLATKNVQSGQHLDGLGSLVLANGANSDASNYQLQLAQTYVTVTPRALTVTAPSVSKVYDANVTAAGTPTISNLASGDSLTAASLAFLDKNVGNNKTVRAISAAIKDGASADMSGNYTINYVDSTAGSITPYALTVGGVAADSKTYDGTTAATLSGTASVSALGSDAVTVNGAAASASFADKNVGTGKAVTATGYVLAGADAGNYTVGQPGGLTADITSRALTITAPSVSKVYDATVTAAGTPTVSNLASGDSLTAASLAFLDKNVGINKTVRASSAAIRDGASDDMSGNYTINYVDSTAGSITPYALTIGGVSADSKTYDGTTAATLSGTASVSALVGDTINVDGSAASASFADKNVGTGKAVAATGYVLAGADAGNYTVGQPGGLTADITSRALTITAPSVSKVYDATVAATGTPIVSNIASGDSLTAASLVFLNKSVGNNKTVRASSATIRDGASADMSGNYTINYVDSIAGSITPYALTIGGVTADSKTYDGTTAATLSGTASVSALGSDAVTVNGAAASASFADKNVGTGKAVAVAGYVLSGADAANYSVSPLGGLSADIFAKPVVLQGASGVHKTYDGTGAMPGGVAGHGPLAGLISDDNVSISGAPVFDAATVGARLITRGGVLLAGSDAGNYVLGWTDGGGTIDKAPLSVRANDDRRPVDGVPYAGGNGVTYAGFVVGEGEHQLGGSLGYTGSSQGAVGAGSYVITPLGLTAQNYDLHYVDGTLVIANAISPEGGQLVPAALPVPPIAPNPGQLPPPLLLAANDQASPSVMTDFAALVVAPSGAQAGNPASGNALGSAGGAGAEGITVSVLRAPAPQQTGVVMVSVPSEMATRGAGFSFTLPDSIAQDVAGKPVRVAAGNGEPLPSWLRYVSEPPGFRAGAVPAGALPMQLTISAGVLQWVLSITERVE